MQLRDDPAAGLDEEERQQRVDKADHAAQQHADAERRRGGHVFGIGLVDAGGVFGEESLIDGRPMVFTARTTARSWIMLLRRDDYLKLYDKHPNLVRSLKDVARRRRKVLEGVVNREVDLNDAKWPDFNPDLKKVKRVQPTRDRGKKKR